MILEVWNPTLADADLVFLKIARHLTDTQFEPRAAELDRDGTYPWDHVEALAGANLLGLFVPQEYGGPGASLTATCAVIEEVSRGCASTGAILSAYALGGFPLLLAGTDQQRERYLPDVVNGAGVSFALTEQGAGSDASALKTTATRIDGGWRIAGEKIYIGNGGASKHYVVFARTEIDGRSGITAFMVTAGADGVLIDEYADKMGIRGTMTSNLKLDTVVADDAVLGDYGRGLRLALQTLNVGRVTVSAQSVGLAIAATDAASREATRRVTFGSPIIDHQGIGFKLADAMTQLTAARMMTYEAARTYDQGGDISILGAMTKLFASEAAHMAADVAVQVFGGDGYCKPGIAERLYRDQRVLEIYEGSSEIQRLVISRAMKTAALAG